MQIPAFIFAYILKVFEVILKSICNIEKLFIIECSLCYTTNNRRSREGNKFNGIELRTNYSFALVLQ